MKRYSILQKDITKCYICGRNGKLHIHEVFYGTANRKKSIEDGCCIWICPEHHNMSNNGIHFNKKIDNEIKIIMRNKWCEYYNKTLEEFIGRYGKSYELKK